MLRWNRGGLAGETRPMRFFLPPRARAVAASLALLAIVAGCATPGLMKRWERVEQLPHESNHFVVFLDDDIPHAVGNEVLEALEFARERVGLALDYHTDDKVVCNLYRTEQNLRNISVGLPLGFFVPRRTPLAYVLGGEVHGRLFTTPSGNVSRLWVSTFPHEYCHVMFRQVTGRHYFQYSWLQEGLGEYFRLLYMEEKVLPPDIGSEQGMQVVLAKADRRPKRDSRIYLNDTSRGLWSYSDWEVRDALRNETLRSPAELSPRTFIGYWRKFNTSDANQIYAISSSLVEYLVDIHGWKKMRALLDGLREESDLDRVMTQVYGFDQTGLNERWRAYLHERWPDPWEPNIAQVYLVRGSWEIDGHEAGIRRALADRNLESAQKHRDYLESRRILLSESPLLMPVSHLGRAGNDPRLVDPVSGDGEPPQTFPAFRSKKAPAIEHYEAAMAAYSMGEYAEGVEHLQSAIDIEPEQVKYMRLHLARGLWLTGDREEAVRLYREELLEAKDPPILNEIAWTFEQAGHKGDALRLYRTIAESAENRGLAEHARARIEVLAREPEGSVGAVQAAYRH